jgi:transposase-like protein
MGKRRTYTKEFKEQAVALYEAGDKSAEEVGRELGVTGGMICRWQKRKEQSREDGLKAFPGKGNPRDEELYQLRKENAELREANEILKKAAVIFATARSR